MPRFCKVKGKQFSEVELISKLYEEACEKVIPYLGIDPGTEPTSWFYSPLNFFEELLNPFSYWFQIIFLLICTVIAFMLGVYVRRRTIIGLLQQKEEWIDKEKMLLSQLWAALEEKLENKSMLKDSRTELDKVKVELDGERAEKESIQSRISSLKRNLKLLESERDMLEGKMNEAISSFSGMRQTLNEQSGGKCDDEEVDKCMKKIKEMKGLLNKLIAAHREEHNNFISTLERKSFV